MTNETFLRVLQSVYSEGPWPKPLHVLKGLMLLAEGVPFEQARQRVKTNAKTLSAAKEAADAVGHVLGMKPSDVSEDFLAKATGMLGQLLLGRCAEMAFEDIYRGEMDNEDVDLCDLRESRTDTDYRLLNGQGRPVYRVNIKFHGARFRRAQELVGLEPEDTFALATYKIHGALQKQQEEGLPYIFVIVGVSALSGEIVGKQLPAELVHSSALIHQAPRGQHKRDFEDAVIDRLIESNHRAFHETREAIRKADWYVLSARRADLLLRRLLFKRVFALRIPNFARAFGRAELDMHFSLSNDLTPLIDFLSVLKEEGMHKTTALLERGEY